MEKLKPSKDLKHRKSQNLLDSSQRSKIVIEEIEKFNSLIKGHRRILEAIGHL